MRVGVIGGGQLARMMIPPAVELGIELRVLAEQPGSSAALAATPSATTATRRRCWPSRADVDVVTFDHEHVPQAVLAALAATGVRDPAGAAARSRSRKTSCSCASGSTRSASRCPTGRPVRDRAELEAFLREHRGGRGREDAARRLRRQGRAGRARRPTRSTTGSRCSTSTRADRRCSPRSGSASAGSWRSWSRVARPGEVAAWPLVETRAARRGVRRGVRAGAGCRGAGSVARGSWPRRSPNDST